MCNITGKPRKKIKPSVVNRGQSAEEHCKKGAGPTETKYSYSLDWDLCSLKHRWHRIDTGLDESAADLKYITTF